MMGGKLYLAAGTLNGVEVMKIGKSFNVKNRQYSIKIPIQLVVDCSDTWHLEKVIRRAIKVSGAKKYKGWEWFEYDGEIFETLKRLLTDKLAIELANMQSNPCSLEDIEVMTARCRYRLMSVPESDTLTRLNIKRSAHLYV
jgi:hypothetical protein